MLATDALARRAVVTTTDGRKIEGELLSEDDQGVTLEISGIKLPIPRDQIQDVQYKASVEEEYKARRARLADNDLSGRYDLAFWLYNDMKAYELALRELEDLAKQFPNEERVGLLTRAVQRQLAIQQEQRDRDTTPRPDKSPAPDVSDRTGTVPSNPQAAADARLTDEDVNIVRVYDVNLQTSANSIRINREAIEQFMQRYAADDPSLRGKDNQNAFRRASAAQQLRTFFQHRAREFYPAVTVNDDPPQMRLFKKNVHTSYVLNYCGTVACHGSDKAPGGYYVFRVQPRDNRTIYSNYLTLYRYENRKGFMVDVERPEDSLLIQYGLRPESAKVPHPEVTGWRPAFVNTQAPDYRNLVEWVESFNRVRQTYPIEFNPPGFDSAVTQPTRMDPATPAPTGP
jgi:hypothetical protein